MRLLICMVGGWLLAATMALAGPPQIENAQLETRVMDAGLAAVVKAWSESASEPSWLGWHVPILDGNRVLCCSSQRDRDRQRRTCNLEGSHRHFVFSNGNLDLETALESKNLVVLLRRDDGEIDRLQVYSDSCPLDAAGHGVVWLEDVEPEESAAFLSELVEHPSSFAGDGLMALALHASPAAGESLSRIARLSVDSDLRGKALFWLAESGAENARAVLMEALTEDPDSDVREEAIFAISMLPDGQGSPILLKIARDRAQPSPIRRQAFFWYVQSGDDEALELIAEILSK